LPHQWGPSHSQFNKIDNFQRLQLSDPKSVVPSLLQFIGLMNGNLPDRYFRPYGSFFEDGGIYGNDAPKRSFYLRNNSQCQVDH
jgi:hypothetical protein